MVSKFPPEDHAAVSEAAAAAAAVLSNATEIEDGNYPLVLLGVTSSRSVLAGSGNDAQRFFHLLPTIRTGIGREEFGKGVAAFLVETSTTSWTRSRRRSDSSSCSRASTH